MGWSKILNYCLILYSKYYSLFVHLCRGVCVGWCLGDEHISPNLYVGDLVVVEVGLRQYLTDTKSTHGSRWPHWMKRGAFIIKHAIVPSAPVCFLQYRVEIKLCLSRRYKFWQIPHTPFYGKIDQKCWFKEK